MMKKLYNRTLLLAVALISNAYVMFAQCSFTGLNANYCTNSATTALTTTATGGTFAGPGVVNSAFNPSIAGPGVHTVTYSICSPTYAITGGTGTTWYNPLPMPTVTTGPETPTSVVLSDDQVTANALSIGFNFKFFCNTYSTFYISSNGFITFSYNGGANGCCSGELWPNTNTPNDLITLTWEDFNPGVGGTISYATVGIAPNRILLVNFNNVPHFGSGGGALTAQLQLYESTNVIEIHTTSMITDGGNHTMGIENINGSAWYAVAGRNSTTNWSATNEMYRFTPGTSCLSTQTTVVSPSTITVVGNNSICVGSTASLTATGNTTYTWSTTSNSNSITVAPSANATYSVSGTNSFGCIANSAITVTVNNTPTVTANSSNGTAGACPGKTLTLNGGGATSYTWTGGVTNGVAFAPIGTNVYTVTGGNACGTATAAISVSIHPFPTVNPVASSASICSGNSVTLTATGNATAYAWSGGVGGISNGVGFSPPLTATYTVIGTSALSCTASATIPVTVYPTPINPPTANPGLICIGGSSTLSATGAANYTWTSSSQTVNTANFIVTPVVGNTTYTITKANSTCYNTQIITVVTNPLPSIFAIVTPTVVCALSPATLAVGGALTYTWTSPGPPSYTFTGASPITSPVAPSIYTVAASDGTCINTTTVFLNANPNPTITATASTPSLCEGETVTLNANGGLNYNWTLTGGATYTGSSIVHTPTTATAYNVSGSNSFGCTSSANQVVLVYPKPIVTASSNKILICSGSSATLTASGASTFSWDANANNVLTPIAVVNPTALTSSAVMYTVEGTNSSTGCKNTQTVSVGVFVPTLTINGSTNTCSGGLINLTAGNGVLGTYNWHTGSGTPITNQTLQMPLTVASVFTLTANSNSVGLICPATQTIALGIYYNPTITAVPARTLICTKESVGITAAGATSYAWNNTMTGPTITVSPTGTTANYTVTGTDDNGCSSTATVQVKISNCSGINELSNLNNEIIIYPNPNDGKFTIQTNADLKLSLVNELGQLIRVINLSATNNHEVNIIDLAKGIYFVSGQKDGLQIYQKIVVTK
ncbi:T9SS type A sorting domain-containing protein [Aurantibacillus circumpalustris]|uniref:T9SS type A sorting domain-containing protein n=1 Tax=Aurantibacillus circumpalustris TaxID=3036359 RepID=UPI00295BEECC|nr:T9SS type A sorting domain-containing protein [Aurantibacillus circumpalustris]